MAVVHGAQLGGAPSFPSLCRIIYLRWIQSPPVRPYLLQAAHHGRLTIIHIGDPCRKRHEQRSWGL